jgi:prepilin-type N-terminal cleavage/methylation domain-containing protein
MIRALRFSSAMQWMRKQPMRNKVVSWGAAGLSLIETMVVLTILGVATSTSLMIVTDVLPVVRADSSLELVVTQLDQAHMEAMDQRRNFIVTFTGTNEITVQRQELDGSLTLMGDYSFSSDVAYYDWPAEPDSPDCFVMTSCGPATVLGSSPALDLGGGDQITFASDGTARNTANNELVNATVFMGISGSPTTARAVTVMGATSRVQGYRFNGSAWN